MTLRSVDCSAAIWETFSSVEKISGPISPSSAVITTPPMSAPATEISSTMRVRSSPFQPRASVLEISRVSYPSACICIENSSVPPSGSVTTRFSKLITIVPVAPSISSSADTMKAPSEIGIGSS